MHAPAECCMLHRLRPDDDSACVSPIRSAGTQRCMRAEWVGTRDLHWRHHFTHPDCSASSLDFVTFFHLQTSSSNFAKIYRQICWGSKSREVVANDSFPPRPATCNPDGRYRVPVALRPRIIARVTPQRFIEFFPSGFGFLAMLEHLSPVNTTARQCLRERMIEASLPCVERRDDNRLTRCAFRQLVCERVGLHPHPCYIWGLARGIHRHRHRRVRVSPIPSQGIRLIHAQGLGT